ncbi:MAG: hypothetical protein WAM39_19355 [Bryobacteraceae bacterium]
MMIHNVGAPISGRLSNLGVTAVAQRVRIFLASPGELSPERSQFELVAQELDRTVGRDLDLAVDLLKWEHDSVPGLGRPQEVVNRTIGLYDLFVGILWRRFGTPTGVAGSGTEEEFRIAYGRWLNKEIDDVMFYFCEAPWTPRTIAELDQARKVLQFRSELEGIALISTYVEHERFADTVRPHLYRRLSALGSKSRPSDARFEDFIEPTLRIALENERSECAKKDVPFQTPSVLLALLNVPGSTLAKALDEIKRDLSTKLLGLVNAHLEIQTQAAGTSIGFRPFRWDERADMQAARKLAALDRSGLILQKHVLLAVLEGNSRTKQDLEEALGERFSELIEKVRALPVAQAPSVTPGPVFQF